MIAHTAIFNPFRLLTSNRSFWIADEVTIAGVVTGRVNFGHNSAEESDRSRTQLELCSHERISREASRRGG